MRKLIYGVGLNDADYVTQINETIEVGNEKKIRCVWRCPYYNTWTALLRRAYSPKYHDKQPTYTNCTVCNEWLTFSNFKRWMEQQDWEGKHLDKDILVKGNKLYSPNTCAFVSKTTNSFTNECGKLRGDWPIGVHWNKERDKFTSQIRNPFTLKNEYLGLFNTPDDAHKAWLVRKLELAKLLAAEQDDPRVAKALVERYENYQPD